MMFIELRIVVGERATDHVESGPSIRSLIVRCGDVIADVLSIAVVTFLVIGAGSGVSVRTGT